MPTTHRRPAGPTPGARPTPGHTTSMPSRHVPLSRPQHLPSSRPRHLTAGLCALAVFVLALMGTTRAYAAPEADAPAGHRAEPAAVVVTP